MTGSYGALTMPFKMVLKWNLSVTIVHNDYVHKTMTMMMTGEVV